jgi:hypothetical protein
VQWSRMSPAFISISILSLNPSMHWTALDLDSDVELNCNIFPVMHPLRASNAPRRRFDCLQGCYPYIDIVSPCRACECWFLVQGLVLSHCNG